MYGLRILRERRGKQVIRGDFDMASYNFHPKTRAKVQRVFMEILKGSRVALCARQVGKKYAAIWRRPNMSARRAGAFLRRMWLKGLIWRRVCVEYGLRHAVFLYWIRGRRFKK